MCFDWLNLITNAYVVTSLDVVGLDDFEKGMFSVVALLEKSSQGEIIIRELFLNLCIPPCTCGNLLCHDPCFGLVTKARAWKGVSQKCNPCVTFTLPRVQESVKE